MSQCEWNAIYRVFLRLTNELAIVISDFGLSRAIGNFGGYEFEPNAILPYRWMAPECMATRVCTYKGDVVSTDVSNSHTACIAVVVRCERLGADDARVRAIRRRRQRSTPHAPARLCRLGTGRLAQCVSGGNRAHIGRVRRARRE